ncbi:MAG: hypothetical protein U0840_16650 [Gemmataceae bacterium]
MSSTDSLRASDPAVVARFLQVRAVIHDRHLARVERLILERFQVQTTRRAHSTLLAHVRAGFIRPGEGELWPVIFTTTIDLSLALCVELSPERVANLGTTINGPQRIRHRGWEDWWGWEKSLTQLGPGFFDMEPGHQEDAIAHWYAEGLDWLAGAGLLRRKS